MLCDPDRIQTCNPQSRNLIFYSVELRGLFLIRKICQSYFNTFYNKNYSTVRIKSSCIAISLVDCKFSLTYKALVL